MQKLEVKPRAEIKIVNIVCTADVKQEIDLNLFYKHKYLSANLDLYSCGYVKTKNMVGRVTVFRTGKMISVGTKNIESAFKELRIACRILKKYNMIKNFYMRPKIQNIVSSIDLERKIDIEKSARLLPNTMYEPEQFAGIILRLSRSMVALIFASGKIILTGGKSYEDINESYFELNNLF